MFGGCLTCPSFFDTFQAVSRAKVLEQTGHKSTNLNLPFLVIFVWANGSQPSVPFWVSRRKKKSLIIFSQIEQICSQVQTARPLDCCRSPGCARCFEGADQLMTNICRQSFKLSLRVLENYKNAMSYSRNQRPFSFLHWANWIKYELELVKKPPTLLKTSSWRWTIESLCHSEQHGQEHYVPGAGSAGTQPTVWGNTL